MGLVTAQMLLGEAGRVLVTGRSQAVGSRRRRILAGTASSFWMLRDAPPMLNLTTVRDSENNRGGTINGSTYDGPSRLAPHKTESEAISFVLDRGIKHLG